MALAKYFSKDLLAINRLLNTNQEILERRLNTSLITIAFDENAVTTFEGSCGLELIIRLISRLYPRLSIIDLSKRNDPKREELTKLALEINSQIEIVTKTSEEDICIVAGFTEHEIHSNGVLIHFGSDNWVSKYSISEVQRFSDSQNPFGSGISACIVASNVFRHIFKDYLKPGYLDNAFNLSVYGLTSDSEVNNPILDEIIFEDVTIVGLGAIGNGTVWALSKLNQIKGNIHLVDNETVSLSNLQRYILFNEEDENNESIKVEVTKTFLKQTNLEVNAFKGKWEDYVNKRNDWKIRCVAVGIDNEKDRIGIQSSLPHVIFNSFTESDFIGINRHMDFSEDACLACSYIPQKKKKNLISEIADNCNIPDKSLMVKDYYNLNKDVNDTCFPKYKESLLSVIAKANKIDISKLSQFNGMKINNFYSNFVCGGIILDLSQTKNVIENVDAPLAFQSAMAGILLAAELVKFAIDANIVQEQRTDFYHLSPIKNKVNPFHRMLEKDKTNRCICKDVDYIKRYKEKWN